MAQDENSKCRRRQGVTHYECLLGRGHKGNHDWDIPDQQGRLRSHPQYMTGPQKPAYIESEKPTLRDQFAMAALPDTQRQFSSSPPDVINQIAKDRHYVGPLTCLIAICCYEMADAMMAARKNPPK